MRDSKRIVYSFILLAVILILLFALNVANGSRAVALSDIPAILSGRAKSGTAHDGNDTRRSSGCVRFSASDVL